jgi:hypothetical protein
MMHTRNILLLFVFCVMGLMGFRISDRPEIYAANPLPGAYRITIKQGNTTLTSVKIVTGSYYTIAYYDLAGKKFVGTEGGTYASAGDKYVENIEFNTMDSTKVGSSITLQSSAKGDKWQLLGTKHGKKINETWQRILEEGTQNSPLKGAWRITQRLDPSTGNMSAMQQGPRKTIKVMSGSRFQWIAYNSATGQFSGTGGGTYTAKDGKYSETIEFFSRDPGRVGMQLTFDYEIKGSDWHHSGKSTTGNTIKEVWSNVDNLKNK